MSKVKAKKTKKSIGFYVGAIAWLLTVANLIAYNSVPMDIYNTNATLWSLAGLALFVVFSLFKRTSDLAPLSLMIGNFMGLLAFVQAAGTIDYLSTHFLDGFSMQAVFALPTEVWFSILSFVVAFLAASLAMYLPQIKKEK